MTSLELWPGLPRPALRPEVCFCWGLLSPPPQYLALRSSFPLAVSSPARAWRPGWNHGLRFCGEKPVDSPIVHRPGPVALHLCLGFSGLLGNEGAGSGHCSGLTGSRPWLWRHRPGSPSSPRLSAPGPGPGAGVWGEGSGCCSLNNKPASAHSSGGCSVCLWAGCGAVEGVGRG